MELATLIPKAPIASQASAKSLESKATSRLTRPVSRRPMSDSLNELTQLLRRAGDDAAAEEQLLGLVYGELRGMAARFMQGQNRGHSLQPTDLVHECFLKIHRRDPDTYANRGHFLAVAARAMRSILVDHARARGRKKRKAGEHRVPLDEWVLTFESASDDLLAVNEALNRLELQSADAAKVVELRFFGGYPYGEIAEILGISPRTVERKWRFARSQMKVFLGE
jgi:RNA polymerase sigma factor (TIGR02999 family)